MGKIYIKFNVKHTKGWNSAMIPHKLILRGHFKDKMFLFVLIYTNDAHNFRNNADCTGEGDKC